MKKIVLSLILVLIFSMVGTGLALADTEVQQVVYQPTETTVVGDTYQGTDPNNEAGVTPDSWLYTFEKWIESLQVLITFSPEGKAELLADLAKERLAESQVLKDKEMYELVGETLQDYVETVTAANLSAQAAVTAGKDISEVINQLSSVEAQALAIVTTVAEKLPSKTQESLVKVITMQEEKLAKMEEILAQKEAKVNEIQKELETARNNGDLEKVAELEKKLAEAQLALAEAKEAAVRKLGQNQIKMVKAQLKVLNRIGRETVSEDVYEKEVADEVYQDPAKLARKEAFKEAKEVRKEAFDKAKEAKKEAVKKSLEVKKDARELKGQERREAYKAAEETKKEAFKEANEVKKEALKEAKEVKKEAIDKNQEARNEADQNDGEEKQKDRQPDKEGKDRD